MNSKISNITPDDSILEQLKNLLNPILSPRQPFSAVEDSLNGLEGASRDFVLHWAGVIASSNIELSYAFSVNVGQAVSSLGNRVTRLWLNNSLAIYDREGLYPAMQALRDIPGFLENHRKNTYTCYLKEVKPRLDVFIRGLAGRGLALKPGTEVFTDTENLFLPDSLSRYPDKAKNRALYKATASFLWAQTWYGTFRRDHYQSNTTEERLSAYDDPVTAKKYFLVLENIRLLANIKRDLPGLHREMSALSPLLIPPDRTWKTFAEKLEEPLSSVEDSFDALDVLLELNVIFPETAYQGVLNLEEVERNIENRKTQTRAEISALLESSVIDETQLAQAIEAFNASDSGDLDGAQSSEEGGTDGAENSQLSQLLEALLQDVNKLEPGMLGEFEIKTENANLEQMESPEISPTTKNIGQEIELDEWDYLRQNYRERWCQVTIRQIEELKDGFKQQTENKYPFIVQKIRKVFEAMRDQPRYANRQTDGDEIDLDALVETFTAKLAGEEVSDRVYIRRQQSERNVAVCLLVDMSGSTKGWINLAMKESLILFSEALNTLGDQYAILGFSGLTRQRCEIFSVKEFHDTNPVEISNRIANIQARDYTRMGFAVRHATQMLLESDGKNRILLLLSDGKPDDYDGYQGEYGIQDTRKAILEAQGQGINPFSITIDKQAQAYLPRLFGPGQYMILNDISALPLKLSEVYRKLSA